MSSIEVPIFVPRDEHIVHPHAEGVGNVGAGVGIDLEKSVGTATGVNAPHRSGIVIEGQAVDIVERDIAGGARTSTERLRQTDELAGVGIDAPELVGIGAVA